MCKFYNENQNKLSQIFLFLNQSDNHTLHENESVL